MAIGAALVLALPASAHVPGMNPQCTDGQMTVSVDLSNYDSSNGKTNTVSLTDTPAGGAAIDLVATKSFGKAYTANFDAKSSPATGAADVENVFTLTVKAWDDPTGSKGWTKTVTKTVEPCVTKTTSTTSPTSTLPPTGTTTPPTHSTTPSTTSVVVAATSTTAVGGGPLPFTGANVGLPLGIAGVLVLVGGGLLFWLRFNARRRNAS